jgi:hypothetical protein
MSLYTECYYAECHLCCRSFLLCVTNMPFMLGVVRLSVIMLSVIMLSVIMLSVIIQSVIMQSVVLPNFVAATK